MGQLWHLPFSSRTSCPDSLVPLMPSIVFEILVENSRVADV